LVFVPSSPNPVVVTAISPQRAWTHPILRVFDTIVGVAVEVAAARIALTATRPHVRTQASQDDDPAQGIRGRSMAGKVAA
jgi:hypothetical protein